MFKFSLYDEIHQLFIIYKTKNTRDATLFSTHPTLVGGCVEKRYIIKQNTLILQKKGKSVIRIPAWRN
ncbi:hypothetical protein C6499_14205 [Candidatus Poribacteria bacterium]|nr:MAG: hypothetical protein C6499_14205 [Candidatus Poribacteria bacterium]